MTCSGYFIFVLPSLDWYSFLYCGCFDLTNIILFLFLYFDTVLGRAARV